MLTINTDSGNRDRVTTRVIDQECWVETRPQGPIKIHVDTIMGQSLRDGINKQLSRLYLVALQAEKNGQEN